jgi:DNA-binding transcriptional MerR regulator
MAAEQFGVDELARRGGTTVRQVRLYVERGLLPHARREGRAAFYGEHHLHRLQMILRLIARGYTLSTIKELTDAWDGDRDLGHVLGLEQAVTRPFGEGPRRVDRHDIAEKFPSDDVDDVIRRALDIGLLRRDGDAFLLPTPAFFDVGAELVETGIPVPVVLDVAANIRAAADDLAGQFVDMFMRHVWQPFLDSGQPEAQLATITDKINRQRAVTETVVLAALETAMQERVDVAIINAAANAEAESDGAA